MAMISNKIYIIRPLINIKNKKEGRLDKKTLNIYVILHQICLLLNQRSDTMKNLILRRIC